MDQQNDEQTSRVLVSFFKGFTAFQTSLTWGISDSTEKGEKVDSPPPLHNTHKNIDSIENKTHDSHFTNNLCSGIRDFFFLLLCYLNNKK